MIEQIKITQRLRLLFVAVALLFGVAVSARSPYPVQMSELRNDTVVSLVTFFQGRDIYELEGHSSLRISSPSMDVAITYGMFDFNSPGFVYRFVKGETDYWVDAVNWDNFLYYYVRDNRRVVQQVLNMSGAQKKRLLELVKENMKPENRVYRYNYVKDNCATRPLEIVEAALGDTIILGEPKTEAVAGDCSFRDVMTYYHENYPWYQFGIDLALGSGIDYTLTNREKAFAPVILCEQLENATVNGQPLVKETIIVNDTPADNVIEGPTSPLASPMAVALVVLALAAYLTWRDVKRLKVTRVFDAILFAVMGLTGCLLAFLVFVSTHEATSPNALLLWLNPLCFIPVITLWCRKADKLTRYYFILNSLALFLMIVGWGVFGQHANRAFFPLILADLMRSISFLYIYKRTNQLTSPKK